MSAMDIRPNAKEMRALELFVSRDLTRPSMSTVWEYASEDGLTHMSTNGHVLALRRAGTHVAMNLHDVAKMHPIGLSDGSKGSTPPIWPHLVQAPNCEGKNVAKRGINPAYFALVAEVEKAAGKRAAADYQPKAGEAKKTEKLARSRLATTSFSEWSIGVDPLDGWYWKVPGEIIWEGLIMPRRV
jgi:hypothetical protein